MPLFSLTGGPVVLTAQGLLQRVKVAHCRQEQEVATAEGREARRVGPARPPRAPLRCHLARVLGTGVVPRPHAVHLRCSGAGRAWQGEVGRWGLEVSSSC